MAKRLLNAYAFAESDTASTAFRPGDKDTWTFIVAKAFPELVEALRRRDAESLAHYLENYGETYFPFGGFSLGVDGYNPPNDKDGIALLYADKLICLAEAVGAVAVENPEQGLWGDSFGRSADDLVARIEAEIGIKLALPDAVLTVGIPYACGLINYRQLNSVYAAWRLVAVAGRVARVCEFGGGLGLAALYAHRLGLVDYTLFDLPVANVFAGNFLIRALGEESVRLYGEPEAGAAISVLPFWRCADSPAGRYDIALNQDSFPEIDETLVRRYLREISRTTTRHFLSINQESQRPTPDGTPQIVVHALLKESRSFRLVQRFPYWIRSGYVEELYEIQP